MKSFVKGLEFFQAVATVAETEGNQASSTLLKLVLN